MSSGQPFKERIVELIKQFIRDNSGNEPTKLYLTNVDKVDIFQLEDDLSRETRIQLHREGPEIVFPRLFGLDVVYGANATRVE